MQSIVVQIKENTLGTVNNVMFGSIWLALVLLWFT